MRAHERRSTRASLSVLVAALCAALAMTVLSLTGPGADARTEVQVTEPTSFRVTSFNILGGSHTASSGTKARMESGRVRAGYAMQLLDNRAIDVAGLQEVQVAQFEEIVRLRGSEWGAYPGRALTNWDTHNTIFWRTAVWGLVEARAVAIPYFHGRKVQMPVVLLRHQETGQEVWFANFHNPASGKRRGDHTAWRKLATSIQVALANQLRESGRPVVFTGDMNEKEVYFCRLTKRTQMKAANGGSVGPGRCRPPESMRIDWIFGSKELRFSGYKASRSPLVRKTSDHPMIISSVTVPVG